MDQSNSVLAVDSSKSIKVGPSKNIVETVIAGEKITTFAAAIQAAGLTDAWSAKGPLTVFAPTDDAFKKLPAGAYAALLKDPAKLKAILSYHVVSGYLMARDLKSGELMTLQGTALSAAVSPSEVRVNGAHITQSDIAASNGIVHKIDAVILPKNWQLLAAAA